MRKLIRTRATAFASGGIALAFFGLRPASVEAQTYTWKNSTGNFSTGFSPQLTTGSTTAGLSFNGNSYTATDDLSNAVSVNTLYFNNAGAVTLARSTANGASNTLNFVGSAPIIYFLGSTGPVDIALDMNLGVQGIHVYGSSYSETDTLSGAISGIGPLSINFLSPGATIALTSLNNTWTGGTYLYDGTLRIAGDGSLGAIPTTAQAENLDFNNATLQFGGTLNANRGIVLEGNSTNGLYALNYGATVAGSISGSGGLTVDGAAGSSVSLTGKITQHFVCNFSNFRFCL